MNRPRSDGSGQTVSGQGVSGAAQPRSPEDQGRSGAAWHTRRMVVRVVVAIVALVLVEVALAAVSGWPVADETLFGIVFTFAFSAVGGVIALQRPSNALGWLLLGMGVVASAGSVAFQYGIAGAIAWPGALPASDVVGGIGFGVQAGAPFGMLITFFLLLFPDGRLPSPRWRPVAWAAAVGVTLLVAGMSIAAVAAGTATVVREMVVDGAFSPHGVPRVVAEGGNALNFAVFAAAVVSLFVRRRRAGPVERLQLRWFAYGAVLLVASIVIPWPEPLWVVLETGATLFLPVTIVIAITRYRLYDIDRLVSRTVTYAAVTAVLVGVYLLIVVMPSVVLDLESDLLVAAATLAAAGVFVPVRRQVQVAVDRRFDRARYDAARVIERFGVRLRDDIDLDSLTVDLHRTVRATVQPAYLSLWLPADEASR